MSIGLLRTLMAVLAIAALPWGSSDAQTILGGVEITATAGYGGYAFPVANWALGRRLAGGGNLQWQLASNYSAVPVRVDFYHRQAIAFRGRIELETLDAYAPAESAERHAGVVTQEFLVPPATRMSVYLTPRVAPRFEPGGEVSLELRVFQDRQETPFARQTLRVVQLEPAHVYSLLLDQPELTILSDTVNPGNELHLRYLPQALGDRNPDQELGMRIFNHYLIPLDAGDRGQVLGAPLAARDFAFVCADISEVRGWSEEEQAALEAYVLAGGHLCLYGVDGNWRGLRLDEARLIGRGVILPVAGGLDSARESMRAWLEGELTEFTLLMPGGIRKDDDDPLIELRALTDGSFYQQQLQLNWLFGGSGAASHGPNYLNPIWIYRETARLGAQEPWDYPEFTATYELEVDVAQIANYRPLLQNINLRAVSPSAAEHDMQPLFALAQPDRAPGRLPLVLLALALAATVCAGWRGLPTVVRFGSLSAGLALGLWLWASAESTSAEPLSYALVDRDLHSVTEVERRLDVQSTGRAGGFSLPADGLLRYVRWSEPGSWTWSLPMATAGGADGTGVLSGFDGGAYVAVATDREQVAGQLPVAIEATRDGGLLRLRIDTSAQPPGGFCLLVTPQGQEMFPTGDTYTAHVPVAPAGIRPGLGRLMAWQTHYSNTSAEIAGTPGSRDQSGREGDWWRLNPANQRLLAMAVLRPEGLNLRDDPLLRLGWAGILQPLGGIRPFMQNQAVLVVPLKSDDARERRFLRLTMPLDGGQ